MIKPIKDVRRINADKKKVPKIQPEWAEAILITLLHKNAMLQQEIEGRPVIPQQTISIKSLENFCKLTSNNKTLLSYDNIAETITIRAPGAKMPEKVINPGTKIITEIN